MTTTNTRSVATMKFDEMTPVQLKKSALEMDTLLRAIAPAAKAKRAERVKRDRANARKRAVNKALAKAGIPLRVV